MLYSFSVISAEPWAQAVTVTHCDRDRDNRDNCHVGTRTAGKARLASSPASVRRIHPESRRLMPGWVVNTGPTLTRRRAAAADPGALAPSRTGARAGARPVAPVTMPQAVARGRRAVAALAL